MYRNYRQSSPFTRGCGCNMGVYSNAPEKAMPLQAMEDSYMPDYFDDSDDCGCGYDEESNLPLYPELAQSYVPIQKMDKTFTPSVGLKMGTIYPELVSPYMPYQDMREKQYIEAANMVKEGCNSGL